LRVSNPPPITSLRTLSEQVLAQREWKAGPGGLRFRDLAEGPAGGASPRKGQRVNTSVNSRVNVRLKMRVKTRVNMRMNMRMNMRVNMRVNEGE
jgi:hypothetical protein